ncbi:M28 family peptidase [Pirellulimonas nuda]|nr:M28 family peptidase [Pirellulimonas nuda]
MTEGARAAGDAPANPLDAQRAMGYLKQVCELGPRPAGSRAMIAQQELLTKHFEALGGQVELQAFAARNPLGGKPVPMANLIVRWRPEAKRRVLLCAHYDTRPLPSSDPNPRARRSGRFIGANDGGSGVAVLMELAHHMKDLPPDLAVDFCLFDGEELVFTEGRDPYFLGSTWFAREYDRDKQRGYVYDAAVLLDMVGDADLQIYQEANSVSWPESKPLVDQVWSTAQRLGVKEFIARPKHVVRDDHLQLRNIAGIPACDVIDFDYPAWHTVRDTHHQCSGESLAKVGWVMLEWMRQPPASRAEEP